MPSEDRVRASRAAAESTPPELTEVRCDLFHPGHQIHWIAALRSGNQPDVRAKTWDGTITELGTDGLTVQRPDGSLIRFLNHHMERLIALSGGVGSRVSVNGQYCILRTPSPDGSYCFSVATDTGQPLDACLTAWDRR